MRRSIPRRYGVALKPGLHQLHHFPQPAAQPQQSLLNRRQTERSPRSNQPQALANRQAPANNEPAMVQDEPEKVEKFMRRCYMAAGMFVFVACWHWMIISETLKPNVAYILAGFLCLLLAFLTLIVLNTCVRLRRNCWFNWIVAWLFVELTAMGVGLVLVERTLMTVCLALIVCLTLLFLCYSLGTWLPMFLLPGEISMCMCLILFTVASIIVISLYIATDNPIYHTIYFSLLCAILVPASVYHAEVVHGRRFYLPPHEFVYCAITVYVHALMFFVSIYYLMWIHAD
ncbi:uncharacterized protein LOC111081597 [Drosophila obscura]|uniref:uncharacterized protein LOC111081597 n=1 Tax=Drosophila obscura TaxID=7282 RepID=UPI000BA06D5D|nr:uncharacterized protein LOC111081597 [Drosophila obscura]